MSALTNGLACSSMGTTVKSPPYAGFAGLKNGVLLAAAEAAGFDIMVMTDQEIPF